MTATNDFQALAIGGSANVITQAAYLSELAGALSNGLESGILPSNLLNKVLRQSSFVSAAVAQLMCDTLGINISDDGNLSEFEANLKATLQSIGRIRLTANTTFNVSTSGSDSTGTGASGAPWATPQHAWNALQNLYDLGGFSVTVNVAAGTYTAGALAGGPLVGAALSPGGQAAVTFNLASGVTINATGDSFSAIGQGAFNLTGSGLIQSSTGNGVSAIYGGRVTWQGVNFGACANAHIAATAGGSSCLNLGAYTISGNAASHYSVSDGCFIGGGGATVTLTGTPAFSSAFAQAFDLGLLGVQGQTFSGAATGKRYANSNGGWIDTAGGGANYFPGSVSGTGANYA